MTKRIFRSIFLASLLAVVIVSGLILLIQYNTYENSAIEDIKSEAVFISGKLSHINDESGYPQGLYSVNRITFIASDGTILYDNTADASAMENQSGRPEVISSLQNGEGVSRSFSTTLSEYTIYYAVRTNDGNVLRISKTQNSVIGILLSLLPALIAIIIGAAAVSAFIARFMSKRIIAPINALNLDRPFDNDIYDELSPLLLRIERQHHEIENRLREISEKQREFIAVTENMREGLILLSESGKILSMNKSAVAIFNADGARMGDNILTVNRSVQLQSVYEGAVKGRSTGQQLKIKGRFYQLFGSPVESDGGTIGAVILILDITDKRSAERSRREFTANVSHELKTPLTSISGFAEIMKNGVANPEDMQDFAGRIYNESNRLISLIDDIIRLSQLDEKVTLPDREIVDLFALALDVSAHLKPQADNMHVSVTVQGEHITITGYRKILDEIIFNLCDNAIKYNVSGGSVFVNIDSKDGKPVVSVKDTGIGIPSEHQPHVFERFYRVDKSRSKEKGGTGLGLSIVKHGALLHGAEINLKSAENEGTVFELIFPRTDGIS